MIAKETQQKDEAVQFRLSLEGNLDAFSDLVQPYRRGLRMKALSIVGSEADAEDVAQNALLKAFSRLSQFRHESQFRTWQPSPSIVGSAPWRAIMTDGAPDYKHWNKDL